MLDLDAKALEWIQSLYPKEFDKIEKARGWLGRYGCTGEQQHMVMSQLSDGQKARARGLVSSRRAAHGRG